MSVVERCGDAGNNSGRPQCVANHAAGRSRTRARRATAMRILAGVMMFAAALGAGGAGCGGGKISIPKEYVKFQSKDGSFSCELPKGWATKQGAPSGAAYAWVKCVSGSAEIKIDTSIAGSAMGDIAKSGNAVLGGIAGADAGDEADGPVQAVHEMKRAEFAEPLEGYRESAPKIVKTGFGPCCLSEFTANGGFGSKIHGYRATMLGHDRAIIAACQGPEKSWKSVAPVFEKVITSLGR